MVANFLNDPPQATELNSEFESDSDPTGTSEDSMPKRTWKSYLRFRLWVLLLMFVPVAYFASKHNVDLSVRYTEEKKFFWKDGMTELDFATLPIGTATARSMPVDKAYQPVGVTFQFGLPLRDPATEGAVGETTAIHVSEFSQRKAKPVKPTKNLPKGTPLVPGYLKPKPPIGNYLSRGPTSNPKAANLPPALKGFIGISGYPFKFPGVATYANTISCFENNGKYQSRFKGSMTIRFHKHGEPKEKGGAYRVGFFAARLNHAETLEVRVYGMDGNLLCRQANIANQPCAFMGFISNRRISRIEIETIGLDKDYAISGLMFDKIRVSQNQKN